MSPYRQTNACVKCHLKPRKAVKPEAVLCPLLESAARQEGRMRLPYFGLGGLPPFLPLARAASALAFDVDCPPLRPNSTAAGFLRFNGQSKRLSGRNQFQRDAKDGDIASRFRYPAHEGHGGIKFLRNGNGQTLFKADGTFDVHTALCAGVVLRVLRFAHLRVCAVARAIISEVQAVDAGLPRGQGFAALVFLGNLFDGWEGVCHAPNIPNRLGSVNRAKWA